MLRKLQHQISRKTKGTTVACKCRFDFDLHAVEGLPRKVQHCRLQLKRSPKTQITQLHEVEAGKCTMHETVSFVATMYRDQDGSFESKKYTLILQVPERPGSTNTEKLLMFGSAPIDLGDYAVAVGDAPQPLRVEVPLKMRSGRSMLVTGAVQVSIVQAKIALDGMTNLSGGSKGSLQPTASFMQMEQDLEGFSEYDISDELGSAATDSAMSSRNGRAGASRRGRPPMGPPQRSGSLARGVRPAPGRGVSADLSGTISEHSGGISAERLPADRGGGGGAAAGPAPRGGGGGPSAPLSEARTESSEGHHSGGLESCASSPFVTVLPVQPFALYLTPDADRRALPLPPFAVASAGSLAPSATVNVAAIRASALAPLYVSAASSGRRASESHACLSPILEAPSSRRHTDSHGASAHSDRRSVTFSAALTSDLRSPTHDSAIDTAAPLLGLRTADSAPAAGPADADACFVSPRDDSNLTRSLSHSAAPVPSPYEDAPPSQRTSLASTDSEPHNCGDAAADRVHSDNAPPFAPTFAPLQCAPLCVRRFLLHTLWQTLSANFARCAFRCAPCARPLAPATPSRPAFAARRGGMQDAAHARAQPHAHRQVWQQRRRRRRGRGARGDGGARGCAGA